MSAPDNKKDEAAVIHLTMEIALRNMFSEYVTARGVTAEQAIENGLTPATDQDPRAQTIPMVKAHAEKRKGEKKPALPGMLIDYGNDHYSFRYFGDEADFPRGVDGDRVKLANRGGEAVPVFLPRCVDWNDLTPGTQVRSCESALKAVACAVRGEIAVGLNGVWGWSADKRLHPQMAYLYKARGFIPNVTFDSDAHPGKAFKEHVAKAQSDFVAALYNVCKVETVWITDVPSKDDCYVQCIGEFLAGGGTAADLEELTYEVDADGTPALASTSVLDLLAKDLPAPKPIVEGFIDAGECNMLISPPKVGKTRLALTAALQIASGKGPMIDIPGLECHRSKVLLFVMEDREFNLQQNLSSFIHDLELSVGDIADQLNIVQDLPHGLDLIVKLDKEAKRFKPDLVIIDNLTSLGIIEARNEPIGTLVQREYAKLNRFTQWAHANGVALLLLIHSKKNAGALGNISDKTNSTGTQAGAVDNTSALDRIDASKGLGETYRRFMTQARNHSAIDAVVTVDGRPVTYAGDWWNYNVTEALMTIAVAVRGVIKESQPRQGEKFVWVSAEAIAKLVGKNANTVRKQCVDLVGKGWFDSREGMGGGYTLTARAEEALNGRTKEKF